MRGLMAEPGESENGPRCSEPECNEAITAYCFGGNREEDRDRFEAHVLECHLFWQEVQRLDSLINTLHSDKSLSTSSSPCSANSKAVDIGWRLNS